jgi:hypothetical protein
MRLRHQLSLIEAALPVLQSLKLEQRGPHMVAPGRGALLVALRILSRVPPLEPVLKPLLVNPIFSLPGDEMVFDLSTGQEFQGRVVLLATHASLLATAMSSALSPVDENMIAFRVPGSDSLKALETTIADLDQCLQQAVVHPKVDGIVRFVGVESGTVWLLVSLGTAAAALVIKVIAYASATIAQERVRHAQAEAYIRTLGFTTEMLEAAKDKAKVAMDKLVGSEAEKINSDHYDGSPEQHGRLVHVLNTLSELFFRGAAIEPAKLPPANVDSGFPNVEKLLEAAGQLKLLPSKPEGTDAG